MKYKEPIKIIKDQFIQANYFLHYRTVTTVSQSFFLNKATGKKISLNITPSNTYKGDGAFTLVNGVQNEKGLGKAKEFLGFSGTDCEAIIDLGKDESFSSVTVHAYRNEASWIYRPLTVEVFISNDGKTFSSIGLTDDFTETKSKKGNGTMKVEFATMTPARFIKVVVKNWGEIPEGEPGAGNKPWLFVDEIEIK
jgi:hexosaminidase